LGETSWFCKFRSTAAVAAAASADQQLSCDARTMFSASVLSQPLELLDSSLDPLDQTILANLRASDSGRLQIFGGLLSTPVRIRGTFGNHRSYLADGGEFASMWIASTVTMQVEDMFSSVSTKLSGA
jgi:hypothetical protein